jgi:PadR family transcriptional regulator, regulatory protein AphA
MTIQYAILGLLSWRPFSGYDLKKMMSESDLYYWSGNNNQIYRALLQLYQDGWVSQHVQPQENLPAKKIYAINATGLAELHKWLLTTPELPELRNTFLIQLAWADRLSPGELDSLLDTYEGEVAARLAMQQENAQRRSAAPQRTPREVFLWEKIHENMIAAVQTELDWVRRVRSELKERQVQHEL